MTPAEKKKRAVAANRAWRARNPEKVLGYARAWRDRNREKIAAAEEERRVTGRRAASQRKSNFGLSDELFQEKRANQEGVCAICRGSQWVIDRRTGEPCELDVDHCHSTGKIRGLLCRSCNTMLGGARDSTANLQNAIAYLEYHHGDEE